MSFAEWKKRTISDLEILRELLRERHPDADKINGIVSGISGGILTVDGFGENPEGHAPARVDFKIYRVRLEIGSLKKAASEKNFDNAFGHVELALASLRALVVRE